LRELPGRVYSAWMPTIESIAEALQDWMYDAFDSPRSSGAYGYSSAGLIVRVDIEKGYIASAVRSERLTRTVYKQRIELDGDLVYAPAAVRWVRTASMWQR
jgi:hypothetical protein